MKLRLLSLNVWALTPPIGRHVEARLRAIGAELSAMELDIAAFQEVWDESAARLLIEAGHEAGLVHHWPNAESPGGGGLLVLSRLPIRSARFEAFELAGFPEAIQHSDYWGGKGVAELTFGAGSEQFALLTTHLHAAYGPREQDRYIGHRVGQVLQLAERVRALEIPVVVAGDLNFEESFEEFAILRGATGLRDVARERDAMFATVLGSNPYRSPEDAEKRIDYVFCRDGRTTTVRSTQIKRALAEPVQIAGEAGAFSDHAGLLASFKIGLGQPTLRRQYPESVQAATRLLEVGQRDALGRQAGQRAAAAAGLLGAPLFWAIGRHPSLSRRKLLRWALAGAAVASGAVGGASLFRSESLRADELAAFGESIERSHRIEEDLRAGA